MPHKSTLPNEGGDKVCRRQLNGSNEVCDGLDCSCKAYPLCKAGGALGLLVSFFDHCPWTYRQRWSAVKSEKVTDKLQTITPAPVTTSPKPIVDKGRQGSTTIAPEITSNPAPTISTF